MKNNNDLKRDNAHTMLENESLLSLSNFYKSYVHNLRSYKENGTLNPEREATLISKTDYVFEVIEGRSRKKKRRHEDSVDSNTTTIS